MRPFQPPPQDVDSETTVRMGSSLMLDSEDFAASASLSAAIEGLLSSLDSNEAELLRSKYGLGPPDSGSPASAAEEAVRGDEEEEGKEDQGQQQRRRWQAGVSVRAAAAAADAEAEAAGEAPEGGKAPVRSGASRLQVRSPEGAISAGAVLARCRGDVSSEMPVNWPQPPADGDKPHQPSGEALRTSSRGGPAAVRLVVPYRNEGPLTTAPFPS
jgi:hypothetical protein